MPFVRTSKGVHGPFSAERLKSLHRQGKLPVDAEYGDTPDGPWRKVPVVKKQAVQGESSTPPEKASRQSSGCLAVVLTVVLTLACCLAVGAVMVLYLFPGVMQPKASPTSTEFADDQSPKPEESPPQEPKRRADADAAKGEPAMGASDVSAETLDLAVLMPDRQYIPGSRSDADATQYLQTFVARKQQMSATIPRWCFIRDSEITQLADSIWKTVRQHDCSFYKNGWVMLSGDDLLLEARGAEVVAPDTIRTSSDLADARRLIDWLKAVNVNRTQAPSPDYAKAFGKYLTAGRLLGLLEDCGALGCNEVKAHLFSCYGREAEKFVAVEKITDKDSRRTIEYRWLDVPALTRSPDVLEGFLAYSRRKIGGDDLRRLCVGDESRLSSEELGDIRAALDAFRKSQFDFCASYTINHPFASRAAVYANSATGFVESSGQQTANRRSPLDDMAACVGVFGKPAPLGSSEYPERTLDTAAADHLVVPLEVRSRMAKAVTAAMERTGQKWMRQGSKAWEVELPIHLKHVRDVADFLVARDSLLLHPVWGEWHESARPSISQDAIKPLVNAIRVSVEKCRAADPFAPIPKNYTDDDVSGAFIAALTTKSRKVPAIYTVEGWQKWCSLVEKYREAAEAFRVIGAGRNLGVKWVIRNTVKTEGEFVTDALSVDAGGPVRVSLEQGDRVLLEGQGWCENGTWIVDKGRWTRLLDNADPVLIDPEAIYDPTQLLDEQPTLYGWAYRSVVAGGNRDGIDLITAQFLHSQTK